MRYLLALFTAVILALPVAALAGLDLENQEEIYIPDLDLDNNGRIVREEAATYMFYYFDHDGNESLDKGEYYRDRPVTLRDYDPKTIPFIDLDDDHADDDTVYTTERFLAVTMVGGYDEDDVEDGLEPSEFMDIGVLRLDTDKSKLIELDEWLKHYRKFSVKKENLPPKAADQDHYSP